MNPNEISLPVVLAKVFEEIPFTREEIVFLLSLEKEKDVELLHRVARFVRSKKFGFSVFLYGFLYFSTYCRNNCSFCHYRKDNISLKRYRKSVEEILDSALALADSGVHLIDLTMGEDPVMLATESGVKNLSEMIQKVSSKTKLPVMVSPGSVPDDVLERLSENGADWFACYQETHNQKLFEILRPDQSYQERMQRRIEAGSQGMLIEDGILTGVGETLGDIACSILEMKKTGVDQARVMSFVPHPGTPLESHPKSDGKLEQRIISVLRLVMPDVLIPASLDIDGINGLVHRLNAGANVVTSIVPPARGFKGVANTSLDIDDNRRSVESINKVLDFAGLRAATTSDFQHWMDCRKRYNRYMAENKLTGSTTTQLKN